MRYEPKFRITPHLLRIITRAAELNQWIAQASVDVPPWLPTLQTQAATRLAHYSTAIEGNPLTLPEVEAVARGDQTGASSLATKEIKNYLTALRWFWRQKPLTTIKESHLLTLHRILTTDILDRMHSGHYKTKPNRIVDSRGHAVYFPPPPAQAKILTQSLLKWINGPLSQELHPIIVSAIAHHRLVSIHPFSDGNGRLSRLLGVWILYIRGFDTHHLFALDEYYESNRTLYYKKLQQARDLDDDLTHWLEYVADGLVQILEQTQKRILSLQISHKAPRVTLTKKQEDMLRFLREHERVRVADIEAAFKITRARVSQIMKPLVNAGLVLKEGQTRATTYRLTKL